MPAYRDPAFLKAEDRAHIVENSTDPAQRYYRPELDVLRFFAFMFVFITHRSDLAPIDKVANPIYYVFTMSGVFGVPVFFLLSAFLITELLERERGRTGRIDAR